MSDFIGANEVENLNFPSFNKILSGFIREVLSPFYYDSSILFTNCLTIILAYSSDKFPYSSTYYLRLQSASSWTMYVLF